MFPFFSFPIIHLSSSYLPIHPTSVLCVISPNKTPNLFFLPINLVFVLEQIPTSKGLLTLVFSTLCLSDWLTDWVFLRRFSCRTNSDDGAVPLLKRNRQEVSRLHYRTKLQFTDGKLDLHYQITILRLNNPKCVYNSRRIQQLRENLR